MSDWQKTGRTDGGQHGGGSGDQNDDELPGQPWEPEESPNPDSAPPPGDGTHRK